MGRAGTPVVVLGRLIRQEASCDLVGGMDGVRSKPGLVATDTCPGTSHAVRSRERLKYLFSRRDMATVSSQKMVFQVSQVLRLIDSTR